MQDVGSWDAYTMILQKAQGMGIPEARFISGEKALTPKCIKDFYTTVSSRQ